MQWFLAFLLVSASAPAFAQMSGIRSAPPPGVPSGQQQRLPSDTQPDESNTGASDSNVVYGKAGHEKLQLDVYKPKGKQDAPRPAVILIHGGAWVEGDKASLAAMGRWLAKNNYVAFSINYRLYDGGHKNLWPAQLDDAQRAVRWVRAHAQKYNVDPAHIGSWGHSAGAQLAALLGELDTRDNSDAELASFSSRVQAVVTVACPCDLTEDHDTDGDSFFGKFLGGTWQQNPQAWHDASPVYRVGKDSAPFLIVHGTRDTDVPIHQSEEMADALQKAGVDATFVKVDDAHTFQTDAARHKLAVETVAFFNRTLR